MLRTWEPEYAKTCARCGHVKPIQVGPSTLNGYYIKAYYSYECNNIKSPLYNQCIVGSWGCIYSTHLSPELIMPNGQRLADFLTSTTPSTTSPP